MLVELLPVLLLGVVPGALAALLGGAVARSLLPGDAPLEAGLGFAVAVLVAVSALVLTTAVAAVRTAREPLDDLLRSGRPPSRRWALGAADAFLLAAVGTGVLAFVTGSLDGPFALAGPALLALLVGLLVGHLAAPAAAALGRRLLGRGRLVAGVALLETGRRRETRAVIAVLTVASALAVFSLDTMAIGERNRANAAEHDAGAPVVLRLAGHDLDGVRAGLGAADPTGHRATPVVVTENTLAVDPEGFRRIAYFPRGAPTADQWRALAPPDVAPVELTGSRVSLTVRTGPALTATDALGSESDVRLSLVVTAETGTRRTISLGVVPPPGERRRLTGDDPACAGGCRLASIELAAASGVEVEGDLELGDLTVDGSPVDLGSEQGWNLTENDSTVVRAVAATSGGLRLQLSIRGFYPVELTPAWVPRTVAAVVPAARQDEPGELVVSGVDGSDRAAASVGRVTLVPAMTGRSALVDLDAVSRGADFAYDARLEVWLVDDPGLVAGVETALRERGITVVSTRLASTLRTTYQDTVATWSLALGAVVGPAVILVALLVLLVLAVSGWREGARGLAILRLNGAGRRTTRRLAVWSRLPAVVLAVVAGAAAGLAGAALAVPDVAFFVSPPESPVIDVSTSWSAVLWAAAACAVVLPLAAALAGRAVAGRAHAERVREAA